MAAHKLPRLSKSILDTPQLITEAKFREIAEVLENRDSYLGLFDNVDQDGTTEDLNNQGFGENVGVLNVEGPLTFKPTGWEMLCGSGCSYTSLIEQMKGFADSGKKTVVMMLDSPGGQAFRAMSSAKQLREIADANDIKLIGYVNGQACSAGYALGSACHELIANGDSDVGSIGVVISLTSTAEKDKQEGIKREFITAGKSKVPYDEDGNFKSEFKEDLQNKINKTYGNFVQLVATMRNLSEDVIRNTEAKVFDAEEALSLGLIDSVMEEDDFRKLISSNSATEFVSAQQLRRPMDDEKMNVVATQPELKTTKENTLMSDMNQITPEMFAELQTQLESMKAENASFKAKEEAEAKASLSAQLDTIPFLTECKEEVLGFMLSADKANVSLMNTVLESAKAENEKVVEEAASQIAGKQEELSAMEEKLQEAQAKVENAEASALKVKEEFGKQSAIEGSPKDKALDADASNGTARTKQLAAVVKQKMAHK